MDRKYTGTKGAEKRLGKRDLKVQGRPTGKTAGFGPANEGSTPSPEKGSVARTDRREKAQVPPPAIPASSGACSLHGEKKCKKTMMCGLETEAS